MEKIHRIVIVGGGASGLELATQLGDRYQDRVHRFGKVHVTLIDKSRTHVWKPKLHEIAAGSMDTDDHELNYIVQAHWHHFSYCIGSMIGLDRQNKRVHLASHHDESGDLVTPERSIAYDTLILAVGSLTNDFGVPGVQEHAIRLESLSDAKRFHQRLINACIRAQAQETPLMPGQLHVAIIGAGATGVELAAELHRTTREVVSFGLDRVDPEKDLKVILVEAAPRILPALPERISKVSQALLVKLGVEVMTSAQVLKVDKNLVTLSSGQSIPAELIVWAAGVKAPDFLKGLDGLSTNGANQVRVKASLQSVDDPAIFAMGDCAACPWVVDDQGIQKIVPPRAQAAHQQASHLGRQIEQIIQGRALADFKYTDFGSLVSLGKFSTVGSMMGGLVGRNLFIEGYFAKLMYLSLYKLHEFALHGWVKVLLDTLVRLINRRTDSIVKLH
jgi:NADH dehydrogenase